MSQVTFNFEPARQVYTVSALTQEIRNFLEPKFLDVWVSGEVSNCRPAASGHLYFTLKDRTAQLRVVCFRNQARYLKFKPQDGVSLIARGRLSVYEARGEYQLMAEYLEPAGLGALQLAFEQLKQKLAAEGLFAPERKKPLPALPRAVGVVTSPTGAVIRDILRVLRRRFHNMNVVIYPALVQGAGAAEEIAAGIRYFSQRRLADVLIVARGGGSIEDLWAFNEEAVARAIAASTLPVISAVGHETDFTIADFVADLRAPTPSAAAELVVHRKQDFEAELDERRRRMVQAVQMKLAGLGHALTAVSMHWVFQALPSQLAQKSQRLDELCASLNRAMRDRINILRQRAIEGRAGLTRTDLESVLKLKRAHLGQFDHALNAAFARRLVEKRNRLAHAHAVLSERSPQAILNRGYAIARDASGRVLRSAAAVAEGSEISVRLAEGELGATVRAWRE
ncbi:MAG: exodeoxyribonuclease VII large subunit [Terriglobia bacterium]